MYCVRKAALQDAPAIATLLLLAMEEIVYHFIGARDRRAAEAFLLQFVEREHNQYAYQNCWVAEKDGMVVGAVNVYDGGQLHKLREPVLAHIRDTFTCNFQPEDETGPDEWYIDTLGVLPACQGQGIGAALLQHLIELYVHGQQQTLGLLVDEDNADAKRLYLRLGFSPAGKRQLFGKPMEHLQLAP